VGEIATLVTADQFGGGRICNLYNLHPTVSIGDESMLSPDRQIPGIAGVDTRALTRHIRYQGAMKGVISAIDLDEESLVAKARASPGLVGRDLVKEVTCHSIQGWAEGTLPAWLPDDYVSPQGKTYNVVAYDYGIKYNILRINIRNF